MKREETEDTKTRIMNRLTDFLNRSRKAITITLGVAAAAVVILFIALEIRSARIENSLTRVEGLQADFDSWRTLESEAQFAAIDPLLEEADAIADKYPRLYAAQRALFVKGQVHLTVQQWIDAGDAFVELADRYPQSYLAAVSLMQAAVAYENGEDLDSASEALQTLVEEYEDESPDAPRALFSLGRISEVEENFTDAEFYYNRLVEDHTASSWTNLARDRIITLTIQGRIGS